MSIPPPEPAREPIGNRANRAEPARFVLVLREHARAYSLVMEPALHGPEENVNRVACLDAFLESFSTGAAEDGFPQAPADNAASPAASLTNGYRDGSTGAATALGGTTLAEGGEGGDIRAVTSGTGGFDGGGGGAVGSSPRDAAAEVGPAAIQAEVLKGLDFLFCSDRPLVESTIQVLDKSRVVKVVARSTGRSVWLVQGSRGAPYLCLREYCSCRSFQELVRRGGEHPVLCKHLLAVRLAPVLGLSATEEVDDDKLAMRLSSCDYG